MDFTTIFSSLWSAGQTLGDVASTLAAFFTSISDYRMWRSMGWLMLGVAMLTGGILLWNKDTVASLAGTAAKAAAL